MQTRDIIVIGASAGGVEALTAIVKTLPPELPAAIFAVLHLSAALTSDLAGILDRSGPLPAHQARQDEPFEPGHIYVAPPDRHLLLDEGRMQLWRGPKENRHRPAVNVLFRSAAVGYGGRVIGVVLSGTLDDGTAGLWWIKRYGGLAMVQDPTEATFPDMIYSALEHVEVDYIIKAGSIGESLAKLVDGSPKTSARPVRTGEWNAEERRWKPSET